MRWMVLALAVALVPAPGWSEELKIEELEGLSIQATAVSQGMFQRGDRQGPGRITHAWNLKIGPQGMVQANLNRHVQSPKGASQRKETANGPMGRPEKTGTTNFVWVLKDDSLVLLRALQTGGFTTSFKLARSGGGWTCNLTSVLAQEVGAGAGRTESAFGGTVRLLNMKQVSSTCKATGPAKAA